MAISYAERLASNTILCFGSLRQCGCVGQQYTDTITVTTDRQVTFEIVAGSLPPGLNMTQFAPNRTTIGGTIEAPGNYTFTVRATIQSGVYIQKTFTIYCMGISPSPILPHGYYQTAYTQLLTVEGGTAPYGYRFGGFPCDTLPASFAITDYGLVALSIAMMIIIFGLFLNSGADRRYPPALIARLHVAGQLLRYLPGRLWGLAFQISTSRETIPAARLARANLDFMIFSVIGSLSIGFVLLAYQGLWPWWTAAAAVAGGGLILGGMFLGAANRILFRLGPCLPAPAQRICELLSMETPTLARLGAIGAVFIASWVVYLAGWSMLGYVFLSLARVDFISLCSYYTLASGIGIVCLLTPAGLGVREAAFVILAAGIADHETVAFFAAFGRIWLMIIEMAMLVLVSLFCPMKKKAAGAIDPRGTYER